MKRPDLFSIVFFGLTPPFPLSWLHLPLSQYVFPLYRRLPGRDRGGGTQIRRQQKLYGQLPIYPCYAFFSLYGRLGVAYVSSLGRTGAKVGANFNCLVFFTTVILALRFHMSTKKLRSVFFSVTVLFTLLITPPPHTAPWHIYIPFLPLAVSQDWFLL